ncbi:MAG TPA: TIGR04283 family arsenosugar biosynthesis glycosyltransferase [bacterium]|nr:TIGR04283 family arsenosugar biosynthesis glycosyltransferase [bacterium]HMW32916.1 TIGR04283 family arsenosugar biosynthesis glycosyltransferase [bacterium]HMW36369.1 TIGR04283 family arsenosugar biosynthesis glycosyltransferase [bacterium]HMY35173.1 TIGR04283 family arsenosugar biosynthesis glycosyltransferase [bacterium]HMZ03705.1 TIGR04283 family arsenosugar biosynthesis glycosyltransferase [bacterium]
MISIIIPTYNEIQNIPIRIEECSALTDAQIILADGGSTDGTAEYVRDAAIRNNHLDWIQSGKGRALQMNAGARLASGAWFVFLHADTSLSQSSWEVLRKTIEEKPQLIGGAFYLQMDHPGWKYNYLAWYSKQRSRLFKTPFGDQAVFVKADIFRALGGYREDFPIMEDLDFVRRLKAAGDFEMLPAYVVTSARRFAEEGFFRRSCKNLFMQTLYCFGVSPSRLKRWYE